MYGIPELLRAPTTPETSHKVGKELADMQAEHTGTGIASVPEFETIKQCCHILHSLRLVLEAIEKHMHRYNFYPAQIVELANLIVERFAPKIVVADPSQFVAMGGMPAADNDDDVVFVRETTQTEEEKRAEARIASAFRDVTRAKGAWNGYERAALEAKKHHDTSLASREEARRLLESAESVERAAKLDYDTKRAVAARALINVRCAEAEHNAAVSELERQTKKARK